MICPSCGEENPERARFCLACATPLSEAPAARGEERKVVSVLFVDLVGFTQQSDRADPEDVRATLRPYHAMLKREIERFGGTVEKFIGDAVMAVFGAPVTHEDDAERAVRAALRIIEAIPDLNTDHGLELSVRAAVDTGEAVVALGARPAEGEGFVTGDVVNTASRLQGVAPVGGAVVGETTYRATRDTIDYEALDPVTVKGKADPIPIWRVLAARGRYGVDVERPRTPFVGRDDDLGLLQQAFARTLREHSVQLVTITGEPGVGKTRLVAEFHTTVDDRPELVYWRQGRCLPYGDGVTFWALGEIVKALAGILESDGPEDASRKLDETVDLVVDENDREWVRPRLAPLVGLTDPEGSAQREESFAAWRTYLESVAATAPLVIVVEDLHWADQAMLEFIEHLVDWASAVPMLVVGTGRPELYERNPGWGGGQRNSATLGLSPLTGEDTARLVAALLDQAVLPAETQELLLERAGGNPLYTEEFVRMLVDRGVLAKRGTTWMVDQSVAIPVPETVHALIAARLDTLTPDRKALLQDASVVGKVFWSGALSAMGSRDEAAVRDGLHDLARKELVRPARRSSVEDQAEYAFWHALIRDVAYGQIPRAGRVEKHQAAAEWIERMAGDRMSDHAELLAYHYEQALELATASGGGADLPSLREGARRFLAIAAERARSLDGARSLKLYQRSLELTPPDHPERARVLNDFAEASVPVGADREAGLAAATEAETLFRATGDLVGLSRAMLTRATLEWQRGDTGKAADLCREAIDVLERFPPGPDLASAYVRSAAYQMMAGNNDVSHELATKGVALARELGLVDQLGRGLEWLGTARLDRGDLGGMEDLRESVRLQVENNRPAAAVAYVNLADLVWDVEGPAEGLATLQKAIEWAERRGAPGAAMWAIAETTWMLFDQGRWDEVIDADRRVLEWDRDSSQMSGISAPFAHLVLTHRGRLDEAASITPRLVARGREVRDPQVLLPALVAAAVERSRVGATDEALALVEEFEEATADRPTWRSYYLIEPLDVLLEAARTEDAGRLLGGSRFRLRRQENIEATSRAMVAEAAEGPAAAVDRWLDAADRWASYGFVLEEARARLGRGRCLVGLDRSAEAAEPLRRARELFRGLGAGWFESEADRWLERATALSS